MSRSGHAIRTLGLAPGTRLDRHTHAEHQLTWARTGVLVVATDVGTWVLPPTRALWIPAGVPHEILSSGRSTMSGVYLRPDGCPVDWAEPQPLRVVPLLAELIVHLGGVHLGGAELGPARRERAEAVLIDLLEPIEQATIEAPFPSDPRARAVAEALTRSPADPKSLSQWGTEVGASARTLARAFATGTGIPFGRWRTALRLRAALPYLAAGESVARVAHRVGYETPSAFVAAFRRETRLTPGAYFRSS
jgi:AraC-like DNA-binding protein/uncharacterized RmlC-like cupin family protein